VGNLLASATPTVRAHTHAPANGTMTRQRLAERLSSSSTHSCCAGGGREARVWAPLVPAAGRNLSGSAGARKPSGQDKAQAAERPCAALEGLPHLVPCRPWGPSAAPASARSPPVPTRLEVPLQRRAPHLRQNHTSTQRLPAWKAAEAGSRRGGRCGLRGRGGLAPHGRQSTTGRRLPSPGRGSPKRTSLVGAAAGAAPECAWRHAPSGWPSARCGRGLSLGV